MRSSKSTNSSCENCVFHAGFRLKEVELAAGAFGVKLQYLDVLDPKDIETAFRAASKGRVDAVLMLVSGGVVVLIEQRLSNSR